MRSNITVVGAGSVGLLLACLLGEEGYRVNVYEKRPDPRKVAMDQGRSINLALSDRGWKALDLLALAESVRHWSVPMAGRMVHQLGQMCTFQPYSKKRQPIYAVSRDKLHKILLERAEQCPNVAIFFNHTCNTIDLKRKQISYKEQPQTTISYDLLVGADGAFSTVRQHLCKTERFNFSQSYLEHGYKEFTIPPTGAGGFVLEKHALHIWPRRSFMLIALPNTDESFTATLFFPYHGSPSFSTLRSEAQVRTFFQQTFPNATALIPNLAEEFFASPTSSLITIKCDPWVYRNEVFLIGDAAHAIVPFYGQGMNCGFEDCSKLMEILKICANDWEKILPIYQKHRIRDANAISDLAIQNFIEMRDHIMSETFLLRKKIEEKICEQLPEKWTPLYTMIAFSHMPYHKAVRISKQQAAIIDNLLADEEVRNNYQHYNFRDSHHLKAFLNGYGCHSSPRNT